MSPTVMFVNWLIYQLKSPEEIKTTMSLYKLKTNDINSGEVTIDLEFSKNILKLDHSNLYMQDGEYHAHFDTYYLEQEANNKYKIIADKVFEENNLEHLSKVGHKAYNKDGIILMQIAEDKKSIEFFNNFDFTKQTGEPGSKVPVEPIAFADGFSEIIYLPEIY